MTPKNFSLGIVAISLLVLLSSCGRDNSGQLTGAENRPKWKGNVNPFGMVYIPSGFLTIGQSDQDIFSSYVQRPKSISITGFYMDETEISNNEYRQFVDWTREYAAHEILGDYIEDDYGNEEIDWEFDIDWEDEALDELYYTKDMSLSGRREHNNDILEYTYDWIDWQKAAQMRGNVNRSDVIEQKTVNVFPDRFVWIRDFSYSYNEPMTRQYFESPVFDEYPVVGVTWSQAKAFCHWRTRLWNVEKDPDEALVEDFRLPSEFEWEYASRGGHDLAPYPWGGYYARNAKGCLLANFKPGRGNYAEDGGLHTVPVDSYFPNDYGLYNMSGNVSEWTETAYSPNAYNMVHDLNPDLKYEAQVEDPAHYKLKVVRGGSWKDIYYFLQTGTRDYEYQDSAKSYIGFRCAMTFLGRSLDDF
jgi:gliding motility-associated lipoprotein GldK